MKMFWIYVLISKKNGKLYVGSGKDVGERLRRHNAGDYRFTKGHRPWELIHKESLKTRSDAVKRERFLKSGVGRKELKEIVGLK